MLLDIKAMAADVARVLREQVRSALTTIEQRLEAVEIRLDVLPAPQRGEKGDAGDRGEKGEKGEKGDTPDVDVDAIIEAVLARVPKPKDGRDAQPEDVAAMINVALERAMPAEVARVVAQAIAELPKPRDGKDAEPVDIDAIVQQVRALIPTPRDGRDGVDADPALVRQEVERAIAELSTPQDSSDASKPQDGSDAHLSLVEFVERSSAAQAEQQWRAFMTAMVDKFASADHAG